jgi:phage-related tail protein
VNINSAASSTNADNKAVTTIPNYEIEKNYHELQEDYHKVVNIAGELIECMEQLCKGESVGFKWEIL